VIRRAASRIERIVAVAALLLLAACAQSPKRAIDAGEQASDARALESWSLAGRVAVSNGKDGGSGRIDWVQDGETYTITIRAPVSNQTWRLSNVDGVVRLEGARPQPVEGEDAEELLAREAGWRLPIAEMQRWIRGVGFAPSANVELDANGLPKTLNEAGWTVTYRAWDTSRTPALPTRIAATRPPYKVRLAVSSWSVD